MNKLQENVLPIQADVSDDPSTPFKAQMNASFDWGRCVFLVLLVVFLLALGYSTIYRTAWNDVERTDYTVYSVAGQAVLDGTNIYEAHNKRGWFYVYPPFFAIFLPLFAKLSLAVGSGLWYLISIAGVVSALHMSVKLARELNPALLGKNWALYEVPAFLASPWLVSGLMRCQASEFMIWLVVASVYFWWRGRHLLGGLGLAAAALIKAFPIALLAYFVWRRQWRFVGAFFLGLVLGGLLLPSAVFGWQKNLDYWQQWGKLVAGPALSAQPGHADETQAGQLHAQLLDVKLPRNQSIESVLLTLDVPPRQAKPVLLGIAALMLAAMAWVSRRSDPVIQILSISVFVTWNLLIPPVSESHYFGLMILPLAVLTAIYLGETNRISRHLALWPLVLFFTTTLWSNLDKDMHMYRLLGWASFAVWASLMALAYRRGLSLSALDSPG